MPTAAKGFLRLFGDYKGPDGDGAQFNISGSGMTGAALHFATVYRKPDGSWDVILRGDDLGSVDLNGAIAKVAALPQPEAMR